MAHWLFRDGRALASAHNVAPSDVLDEVFGSFSYNVTGLFAHVKLHANRCRDFSFLFRAALA